MCEGSERLVAHLGHICVGSVIEVTAVPLSPQAYRIIAEHPDLVPRLAGAGDDCESGFTSPPDPSPAIECCLPELALPTAATGAIERKTGERLVDADRKRAPITASGWRRF
jgi:thiamine monophosphate kinase